MKTYDQFHGETRIDEIGKELRIIAKNSKDNFKILTGYGSSSGVSKSKDAAIKSLRKMKKDDLILGFLPGEIKHKLLMEKDEFYLDKLKYENIIRNDSDYGNDGIIFVFVKKTI